MRRREEAIEAIEQAIDIFENPSAEPEEKEGEEKVPVLQKQLDFNRIQYQNFLCSCLFIQGIELTRVMGECEKGIKLCNEFSYDLLKGESDKLKTEFESIMLKSQAK